MHRMVHIECPYCGTINRILHKFEVFMDAHGKAQLVRCEIEEGGCEKKFVVETTVVIESTVYKLEEVE